MNIKSLSAKNIEIYKTRRKNLIKNMPEDSALILPSWPKSLRSGDVEWPYRPSSDLIYLSGFPEPYSCLMILSKPSSKTILFVQEKDLEKEFWTGPIYGPKKAGDIFQVDACYSVSEFSDVTPKVLKNISSLYYTFDINAHWDIPLKKLILSLKSQKRMSFSIRDPVQLIVPLRMKKEKEEISSIKKAISISEEAHIEVMKHTKPGLTESELHGKFLWEIKKRGASAEAYPSIVASGPNACILHYIENTRKTKEGDLLLIDAGAEYDYYTSDITRTFPVSGKFSKVQKNLYTKLLLRQKTIIENLKPGISFNDIQSQLVALLSLMMKEEGLLSGSVKEIIEQKKYKKYFPHSFGHSLGLDVHDPVFSETNNLYLKEDFVLTIEPGLYLPPEDMSLKPELRGLGFRIEDDILITKTGAEVLSKNVPKEAEEIEELILSR